MAEQRNEINHMAKDYNLTDTVSYRAKVMDGYSLVSETANCLIYESNDYTHELWVKKETVL